MRQVTVQVIASDVDAATAYHRIGDFRRYPELTDAVDEVVVHASDDGADTVVSAWAVRFRNGILRWTERDTFDRARLTVHFEQLTGDFATFTGAWHVTASPAGTRVSFEAAFDLGIPTLAAIIDPVAEAVLQTNILAILEGLLGPVEPVVGATEPVSVAELT
jgi:ribosome-associated toxin RatA of RatAB toxin-antitoxin module